MISYDNYLEFLRLSKFEAKLSIERDIVNYGERKAEVFNEEIGQTFTA